MGDQYVDIQLGLVFNFVKNFQINSIVFFWFFLKQYLLEKKNSFCFICTIAFSIKATNIFNRIENFLKILNNSCSIGSRVTEKIKKKCQITGEVLIKEKILIWKRKHCIYVLNFKSLAVISIFNNVKLNNSTKKESIVYGQFNNYESKLILAEVIDKKKSIKDFYILTKFNNKQNIIDNTILIIQQRKLINLFFFLSSYNSKNLLNNFYLKIGKKNQKFLGENFHIKNLNLKIVIYSRYSFLIDIFSRKSNVEFLNIMNKYFFIKKRKKSYIITWLVLSLNNILPGFTNFNLNLHLANLTSFGINYSHQVRNKLNFKKLIKSSHECFGVHILLSKFFIRYIMKLKITFNYNRFAFFFINTFFIQKYASFPLKKNSLDINTIAIYCLNKKKLVIRINLDFSEIFPIKRFFLFFFQLSDLDSLREKLLIKKLFYYLKNHDYISLLCQTINTENLISFLIWCLVYLDELVTFRFLNNLYEIFFIVKLSLSYFCNLLLVSEKVRFLWSKIYRNLKKNFLPLYFS
nr:hypothetical protein Cry52Nrm1_p012 [Cryptomonas curvata]